MEGRPVKRPLSPPRPDWYDEALCQEIDPELFFPEQRAGSSQSARNICRACPVETECLDWALEQKEPHGIWGGASASQRRRLARERGLS